MGVNGGISLHVDFEDNSKEYLSAVNNALSTTISKLGADLQQTAKAAAPQKTGHLVNHIVMKANMSSGAYQAEVSSTASEPNHDYVEWMHKGPYNLGELSRSKPTASSKLGNYSRTVGPGYLISVGEGSQAGYQEFIMKQVESINSKWN